MGVLTHLPSLDVRNDGWTLIGTGVTKLFEALNNDDDAKYIKSPASKATATVKFPVDITTVPEGAVIVSVTVKLRVGTGTGSAPAGTSPSIAVQVVASDDTSRAQTRTISVTGTITTYEIATYKHDARAFQWDIERINHLWCRVFSYVSVFDLIRCYKFFTEIKYRVRPTITVDAPTGTVNTPSPTISWTYTQSDGDPQTKSEYKLFTAVQQSEVSFNPEIAPPVYATTVDGDVSSVILPTSINPDNYWVYVRSTSSFGARSTWVGRAFTVAGPAPGTPGVPDPTGAAPAGTGVLDVVPDEDEGSAQLTMRDTSNMLSVQAADAETLTDGNTLTPTNCTIVQDTTSAYPGGIGSWKLTSSASGDMAAASDWQEIEPSVPVTARCQFRTVVSARSCRVRVLFYDAAFASVSGTLTGSNVTDATGTWTEATVTGSVPATAVYARVFFDVLATGGASEIHNVDHLGLMYGTSTPWSNGGHMSRNLLSHWYSTTEGTAGSGEAWTAGSGTTTTTNTTVGTGFSGTTCNKMTYAGISPTIALRAAGTVFTSPTSGADFTLNKPAGTASGDLMLAFLSCTEHTTLNLPAGWTLVNQAKVDDGTTDTSLFVLKRVAGGSEPASWTDGTLAVNALRRAAVVIGYSGASDIVPESQASSGTATPLYLTTPTINNSDPSGWRVSAFAVNDDATGGTMTANRQAPSAIPDIQYVGKGTAWGTSSTGTSFTINKPSGVVQGDLMIAVLTMSEQIAVPTLTGWTLYNSGNNGNDTFGSIVWYRFAGASEPSSWSGTITGVTNNAEMRLVQAFAYRNVHATTPFIDDSEVDFDGSGNAVDTGIVTNTNSQAWRVCMFSSSGTNTSPQWTSDETVERADVGQTAGGGWFDPVRSLEQAWSDSNGPVSTGNHQRTGWFNSGSYYGAISFIALLNPLATPPSPGGDETARITTTMVGSSNPWMNIRVFDSNGVAATGNQSITGIWTPGSGTDKNSMAGWFGIIKPAAPVTAGYAVATMATTVDVSHIDTTVIPDTRNVAVCTSFLGSTAGTPYLTVNFYRANVLLNSLIAQGVPFDATTWTKSYATFEVPDGVTRMNVGVSASDRAVNDIVYWDRVSLAFGTDTTYRPGTSRAEHPVWGYPEIQFADDDGTGFTDYAVLRGTKARPPSFNSKSGLATYVDHTVVPLISRRYRARTISIGLAGDTFVSGWGPVSSDFSFVAVNFWLKDITNPDDNIKLPVSWKEVSVSTSNTATVFQPMGENYPVVLTEGYKGDTFPLDMIPVDHDTWVQLKKMLKTGKTLFLQTDIDHAWFVRPVGDMSAPILPTAKRKSKPLRSVKINFVEVAPEE